MNETLTCGHEPTPTYYKAGTRVTVGNEVKVMTGREVMSPGYGTDPLTGERYCYPCCERRERKAMADSDHYPGYVSEDGSKVTTWTGGELAKITSLTRSNAARKTFVHAVASDGSHWTGQGPLDSGAYVNLRRVRTVPR